VLAVADAHDRLNPRQRGRAWTTEELTLAFVKDVGDLAKEQLSTVVDQCVS
jgi:hypothetical protein